MTRTSLLSFAALTAISTSLVFAQAPPAPTASDAPPQGMKHGGPQTMQGHGKARGGAPMGGDRMGGGFNIVPPGMWWKNPTIVTKLTLTPDQVKKMDDTFQQSRLQLIDLKGNVEKAEIMLEPMLGANPPDMARTMAQIDKVAQARAELEKADAKMLLGIRVVLTPDQWTKLHTQGAMGGGMPGMQGGAGHGGPGAGMQGRGGPMGASMGQGSQDGGQSRGPRPAGGGE